MADVASKADSMRKVAMDYALLKGWRVGLFSVPEGLLYFTDTRKRERKVLFSHAKQELMAAGL